MYIHISILYKLRYLQRRQHTIHTVDPEIGTRDMIVPPTVAQFVFLLLIGRFSVVTSDAGVQKAHATQNAGEV